MSRDWTAAAPLMILTLGLGVATSSRAAQEPGAEPGSFRPSADRNGVLLLPADRAQLKGEHIRLADDRGHVADWLDTRDRVEWAFELPEPGRFVLLVEYSAPSGRGGSLFEVEVAGQVRQGDVHATGAPDRFLPQPMMTAVDLEAGPQRLVVRALEAPRGFVMNLRRVRLVPAED